jgi:hypothetical protein
VAGSILGTAVRRVEDPELLTGHVPSAPLGIRHLDLPCTPERVRRAVRDASEGRIADPWREPPAVFGGLPVRGARVAAASDDGQSEPSGQRSPVGGRAAPGGRLRDVLPMALTPCPVAPRRRGGAR